MCTSLTYTDTTDNVYFARTMDFPTTTPWRPIFLPRGYVWPTGLSTTRQTRYAILGGGRLPQNFASCLMADGVNEAGLSCAELYLPNAVNYQSAAKHAAINLTPQGFINWVLGEHTSVAAVRADLDQVNLVAQLWGGDDQVYPFHWYLCDRSGASIVIEPTTTPLQAQPNPSGVLTNTPVLSRHLANLNQYLGLNSPHFSDATLAAAQAWLAQHRALPDGPLPTDRFIRTAIHRLGTPALKPHQVPSTLLAWLAEVSLPYVPARESLSHNYTHYRSVIDLQTNTYHFMARNAPHLRTLTLTPQMSSTWHVPFVYRAN